MKTIYPLTLLYDGACPVCSLEMDHLRARNSAGRLVFVDIAAPGFDATPYGATRAELDAEIHAVAADDTTLRGMDVLRLAYAAAGLGWVLQPTGLGPLKPVFDAGYRVFARHRRSISRAAAPVIAVLREARARRLSACKAACGGAACAAPAGRAFKPESRQTS